MRSGRIGRGEHGRRDKIGIGSREAANGLSRPAQLAPESASIFTGGDDLGEKWDESFAVRLVEMIGERAAQAIIVAREKGRGDSAGIDAALDCEVSVESGG